jgi:hypothetical protein
MIKVYAVSLAVGLLILLVLIYGGTLADNLGRPERDPDRWFGLRGKLVTGAILGFGMGGMAAEFSPIGFSWPIALLIAVGAAGVSVLWVRYSVAQANSR